MKYTFAILSLTLANAAFGATVMPQMGGGQVPMMMAGMKHAEIDFDGTNLSIHLDETVATPTLRELDPGDRFDPGAAWAVLEGKAYNFQYGWLTGSIWAPPAGLGVFVEQLSATPGLLTHDRSWVTTPMSVDEMSYEAILTDGQPWRWNGRMTHNAYAVENPMLTAYEATYRVFLADATTGVEPTDLSGAPLYGAATATFHFQANPIPEPAAVLLNLLAIASCSAGGRRA